MEQGTIVDNRETLCSSCKELPLIADFHYVSHQIHENFEDFISCGCTFCQWLYTGLVTSRSSSTPCLYKGPVKLIGRDDFRRTLHLEYDITVDGRTEDFRTRFLLYAEPSASTSEVINRGDPVHDSLAVSTSQIVDRIKPAHDPSSDQIFSKIRTWLAGCSQDHLVCRPPTSTILPAYLVDVGPDDGPGLARLVHTKDSNINRYIALSYVWGVRQQPVELTRNSRIGMLKGIQEHSLPRTITDAILVARRLKVRHLWVDALCIIQDDKESKKAEIAKMQHIFGNSFLTIQADNAGSVHEGFLKLRDPPVTPFQRLRYNRDIQGLVYAALDLESEEPNGPTSTRAWCYEEAVLSNRLLVYRTNQVIFKCRTEDCFEDRRKSTRESTHDCSPGLFGDMMQEIESNSQDQVEIALRYWYPTLDYSYSPRALTKAHDRLPAILGVAQRYNSYIGGRYIAGLWEKDMIWGLRWSPLPRSQRDVTCDRKHSVQQGRHQHLPSWSWAAWDGPVSHQRLPWSDKEESTAAVARVCHLSTPEDKISPGKPGAWNLIISTPTRMVSVLPNHETSKVLADLAESEEEAEYIRQNLDLDNFLLITPEGRSRVGMGIFDHWDEFTNTKAAWCAFLTQTNGLLLEPVDGKERTFRRIGVFYIDGSLDIAAQGWFDEQYRAEICIV